jgi:hypothetical protein
MYRLKFCYIIILSYNLSQYFNFLTSVDSSTLSLDRVVSISGSNLFECLATGFISCRLLIGFNNNDGGMFRVRTQTPGMSTAGIEQCIAWQ